MTTCITNRCSQGNIPCPTPGMCNGNTQPALPIQYDQEEEQRDAAEVDEASIWILGAACLFAVVALIAAAAGVLSVPL